MIRTKEYALDVPPLRSVMQRVCFRLYSWGILLFAICGVVFMLLPEWVGKPIGIFIVVFAISIPYGVTELTLYRIKRMPIHQKAYVVEFDVSELRQLVMDELFVRIKYADCTKGSVEREGLCVFLSATNWLFVARSAFASAEDFESACRLVTEGTAAPGSHD